MRFTVDINCDNAAFEDDPVREITRLLRDVTNRLESGDNGGSVRDVNGNTVGNFMLEA